MNLATFYIKGILRQLLPYSIARRQRVRLLSKASRYLCHEEIDWRVDYNNSLSEQFDASLAPRICNISRKKSRYYLDLDESTRGFGPHLQMNYLFGDICIIPEVATIVKSRPICAGNENSIILKLDNLRHFSWSTDPIPFSNKKASAVWRGTPLTEQRKNFVRRFYDHKSFNIGQSRHVIDELQPKPTLTHREQKEYKFFVSIEGNDVATNLKWALASNMLVMAPLPRYETWFMEGLLEPGKHFVLLKDDLSDLEEKVDYFSSQTKEAEEIIRNAHAWVNLFTDPLKERIIAARILEKYFQLSGQL